MQYVNVPFDLFSQKVDFLMRLSTEFPIKEGLISLRVHGSRAIV